MKYLKGIWVSSEGGFGEVVSDGIELVTSSGYSHVAAILELDGKLTGLESYPPSTPEEQPIHTFSVDKYKLGENGIDAYEELLVPIPDDSYPDLEARAKYLLSEGYGYGWADCVAGFASAVAGKEAGNEVVDHFTSLFHSRNCSATWTELIRSVYPQFLEGQEARSVEPEQARLGTLELLKVIAP